MVANVAVLVKCPIPETTRGSTTTTRKTHCIQPNQDSPLRPHQKKAATVTIKINVVTQ